MNKKIKEIEYEDAPSGFVKLYNYKEPFMKYEGGFGYQGVLLFDGESDKVQCHMCGKWFEQLGGHLIREHNMYASDYKEMVGLFQTTALVSEKVREKLIANGKNSKNLKIGKKKSNAEKKKISNTLRKNADVRQRQNIVGTCPAQLLAKLQAEYQLLGQTPRDPKHANRVEKKYRKEALESAKRLGARETYVRVFGSWANACEMANIPLRKAGQTITVRKSVWTKERAIEWTTEFIDANGRVPMFKDVPSALSNRYHIKKLVKSEIEKEASLASKQCKGLKGYRYSKEQLLQFLTNFEKTHNRRPSYSDSKRGLIPHLSRYSYNFGSWKKAINLAFK